jgi:hypothetical protein
MHIHDFYSKLTSADEGGPLFEAFRSLSRIEPAAMSNHYVDPTISSEWPSWPSMAAHASDSASEGV